VKRKCNSSAIKVVVE